MVIIPTSDRGAQAQLPPGVTVSRCLADSPLLHNRWLRPLLGGGSSYRGAAKAVATEVGRYMRSHGLSAANTVAEAFWFDFQASGLSLLDLPYVARAHRYDLYIHKAASMRERTIATSCGVYAVSQAGADELSIRYPEASDNIGVSYLGVSLDGLGVGTRHTADDHTVTFITVARAEPVKRLPLALQSLIALANVRGDLDVRWIHVGDGSELDGLKQMCLSLPSNLTVEFCGSLDNADVRSMLSSRVIDFMLLLSSSEGLPVSLLEAMACGIIPVATDVGGVSEAVDDDCGVLMPADLHPDEFPSGIIPFIDGDFRSRSMAEECRRRVVEKFDASVLRADFARRLRSLLP